ncbi:flagellar biosynthesis protein FlgN [bacterium]|nr:flagellar biosynthesis protein FlgN [bacterium]
MNEELTLLIAALREELAQYGEMLALLDREQELVVARGSAELLQTVDSINFQSEVVTQARKRREECQRQVAVLAGLPANATIDELKGRLPANHAILVVALVEENNELLVRVRQRARQNHILLNRSLELMQRLIGSLFPTTRSATYSGDGQMRGGNLPQHTIYEAVG